jgi:hypothetical protein
MLSLSGGGGRGRIICLFGQLKAKNIKVRIRCSCNYTHTVYIFKCTLIYKYCSETKLTVESRVSHKYPPGD